MKPQDVAGYEFFSLMFNQKIAESINNSDFYLVLFTLPYISKSVVQGLKLNPGLFWRRLRHVAHILDCAVKALSSSLKKASL